VDSINPWWWLSMTPVTSFKFDSTNNCNRASVRNHRIAAETGSSQRGERVPSWREEDRDTKNEREMMEEIKQYELKAALVFYLNV